jgi:hypothetical protein
MLNVCMYVCIFNAILMPSVRILFILVQSCTVLKKFNFRRLYFVLVLFPLCIFIGTDRLLFYFVCIFSAIRAQRPYNSNACRNFLVQEFSFIFNGSDKSVCSFSGLILVFLSFVDRASRNMRVMKPT